MWAEKGDLEIEATTESEFENTDNKSLMFFACGHARNGLSCERSRGHASGIAVQLRSIAEGLWIFL